jgi:DNA invertase Pin-like site-specific DNA recombinase
MEVALYARVSSSAQDVDLSVSAQLRALRDYAARNNYVVVREFVDEAETGRNTERPAFREMISMARRADKPFETILVWKYSRFTRRREDSIVFKAMLKKNGVQVISITEQFNDTPTGRLMEAIVESLDEFYSDNLGEEVNRGMRESVSRGFYLSARTPYGYRKVRVMDGVTERTKLEIEPTQKQILLDIFNDALAGKGLTEITQNLNSRGITGPKGKGWGKTSVYQILTNTIYTGTFIWGRNSKRGLEPIRVDNTCPPMVNKSDFEQIQKSLGSRSFVKVHPRRTSSNFLLSGLVHCGHCGKALVGQNAKSGKFSYYICGSLNKKGAGACPALYLNSSKFESQVVSKIKELIFTEDNFTRLVELVNDEMDKGDGTNREELTMITGQISEINHRLENLYRAIEDGHIDFTDLKPRIHDLRNQQELLLSQKAQLEAMLSQRKIELASPAIVKNYVEDLRSVLSSSPLVERKSFVKSFIKEIKVTGKEVRLAYTLPLSPDSSNEEQLGVLPIVQYGGRFKIRT